MKNFSPKSWSLKDRILSTVAFFDVFDVGVRESELRKLVLGDNLYDEGELLHVWNSISSLICRESGVVFLKDSNAVASGDENFSISKQHIKRAKRKAWIFRMVPFIEFVAICNYLPFGIADSDSDIDLLVISRHGRIFTVRLFLTFITHIMGMRRHGDNIRGKFCLSFYIDEMNMDLSDVILRPYDIYFAYWMLGLMPIYGRNCFYESIQKKNSHWLSEYFENLDVRYDKNYKNDRPKGLLVKFFESILKGKFGDSVEGALKGYFLRRHEKIKMKLPENASVEVNSGRLKFHNNDKRRFFLEEFEKRLKRLGFSQ